MKVKEAVEIAMQDEGFKEAYRKWTRRNEVSQMAGSITFSIGGGGLHKRV